MKQTFFRSLLALVLVSGLLATPLSSMPANAKSGSNAIPGKYIVVLKDDARDPQDVANNMAKQHGLGVEFVYTNALHGFAANIPDSRLQNVKDDARVQFVSQDHEVNVASQVTPTGVARINAPLNTTNKGTGVGVAVIDTGINLKHADLQGNIIANYSCVRGKRTGDDDNGHGSHVAGTIAALDNGNGVIGVAPEAKLVAVKVLNAQGSGTWSTVICGIDWVTAHAAQYGIKVANMSLGGGGSSDNNCGNSNSDALHKAICRSTNAGVTYVVAAGNDGANANASVPSAYNDTVITVSALADSNGSSGGTGSSTSYGADDTFASFSNYGSVVDIGAPGVSIYSTWKGGGYNTISGTSMATPHVSGAAALYMKTHPSAVWSQVRDGLVSVGEASGSGHTDPSGLHPEKVLQVSSL